MKTGEFQRHTRQTRLSSSTNSAAVITKAAEDLMSALLTGPDGLFAAGQVLRLLGVGCSGIDDSPYTQLDLFTWAEEKQAEDARREEALRETEERRQEEIRRKKVRREAEIRAKEKAAEDLRVKEEKQRRLDEMLSAVQKKYGEKSLRKGEK